MTLLKFNKQELVNLSYSLRREIILANKTGAYCNTSIIGCNTRRYHALLAVTLDRFGGDKYVLLSSINESILIGGKQFNLGINCYGDMYEPKGHKYIVDFKQEPNPEITYKIGETVLRKTIVLVPDQDRVMIKYELLESPSSLELQVRPLMAFRNIHALTSRNDQADTSYKKISNGASFKMYANFPDLCIQTNLASSRFVYTPYWYFGVTYSDEWRRGFDCREDLFMPGYFSARMKVGDSLVVSASTSEENTRTIRSRFDRIVTSSEPITSGRDQLKKAADLLICNHNGRKKITAGFSWMYTGLLRETLISLAGLTLYAKNDTAEFEEILDNLIADEEERLYRQTTQIEAPLLLACALQSYQSYGVDPRAMWKKYGKVLRCIVDSYKPGVRNNVALQPNGLLWAEQYDVALSWMNAYIDGKPVTPRYGYQVETNAYWYNAVCYAVEMEKEFGSGKSAFVKEWGAMTEGIRNSFMQTFWHPELMYLADYVDWNGQHMEVRPNQLLALALKYSPVDEEMFPAVLKTVESELFTVKGIRTLSPRDQNYKGVYDGTQIERDLAYHQGSTRPRLLAPYVELALKVKGPSFIPKAMTLVENFYEDLGKHGIGTFSELYDGDPPQEPHGAISSALSVAALLTIEYLIEKSGEAEKL